MENQLKQFVGSIVHSNATTVMSYSNATEVTQRVDPSCRQSTTDSYGQWREGR